jgi:hypothetical protein
MSNVDSKMQPFKHLLFNIHFSLYMFKNSTLNSQNSLCQSCETEHRMVEEIKGTKCATGTTFTQKKKRGVRTKGGKSGQTENWNQ